MPVLHALNGEGVAQAQVQGVRDLTSHHHAVRLLRRGPLPLDVPEGAVLLRLGQVRPGDDVGLLVDLHRLIAVGCHPHDAVRPQDVPNLDQLLARDSGVALRQDDEVRPVGSELPSQLTGDVVVDRHKPRKDRGADGDRQHRDDEPRGAADQGARHHPQVHSSAAAVPHAAMHIFAVFHEEPP